MRLQLYPNLYTTPFTQSDGAGDGVANDLDTIVEDDALDANELTEENYTSEAVGESDDDNVRGGNRADELDDDRVVSGEHIMGLRYVVS